MRRSAWRVPRRRPPCSTGCRSRTTRPGTIARLRRSGCAAFARHAESNDHSLTRADYPANAQTAPAQGQEAVKTVQNANDALQNIAAPPIERSALRPLSRCFSSRLAISGPAADNRPLQRHRRCPHSSPTRSRTLLHPALAFALLADRGAQRGLDRAPVLQLLAGETQRARAAARSCPRSRRRPARKPTHGPNPCSETNSGPIIASATAPANTAFFMQSLQFGFAMMTRAIGSKRARNKMKMRTKCDPLRAFHHR